MHNSKIIILVSIFVILFLQNNLKAEIIKFTNCKIIKDPISEIVHETFNKIQKEKGNKTKPYNEKEELNKLNDKFIYVDRSFDTESKILHVKRKKKDGNEESVKDNFVPDAFLIGSDHFAYIW